MTAPISVANMGSILVGLGTFLLWTGNCELEAIYKPATVFDSQGNLHLCKRDETEETPNLAH